MKIKKFKEMVNDDLSIFFNLDEFAEMHRVEGKEVSCIFNNDSHGSTSKVADKDLKNAGINEADCTLYVKREDCNFKFSAGKILNIDGKELQIGKVSEEMNVLVFELYQYRRY